MFRFRLEVAGEALMDRGIARFSDRVADYRPIWNVIADDFYAAEKRQFATQGSAGGDKWAPLSPEYAGWKAVQFPGKPILERTGALIGSLTSAGDPNAVREEQRKRLTLGTKVPYAIYHQSPKPRKRLPRRMEIQPTEAFKRQVMAHVHGYLVQIATKSGLRTGGRTPGAPYRTAAGSAAAWRSAMRVKW